MNNASVATSVTQISTPDQLLEAASSLMRERDTIDISISDIGRRAGANSALVKYYFRNKEGLMLALMERDLSLALPQLTALLKMDMAPRQKMRMHLSGLIRLFFMYPYLNRLMMALMRDGSAEVRRDIAARYLKPIFDAYEILIDEGVRKGDFKKSDPKLFYFTVIGACDQIFSTRYVLEYVCDIHEINDELRKAYVDHTITMLTQGLFS